jgi:thiol-disulfide isomerase/thioredoxin
MRQKFLLLLLGCLWGPATANPVLAPEFTHTAAGDWLYGPPLKLSALRGRLVLLDVWTTDCWNCYRSFPWLKSLRDRFASQGLVLIGVHSPEFEREKDPARVKARLAQYGLAGTPTMLDADFSYWHALGNQYWPAFYLIGRDGSVAARLVGEQHAGSRTALVFEQQIRAALSAPPRVMRACPSISRATRAECAQTANAERPAR